tara:strand:- start:7251 stop:8294 length:1044 start_codon:yes stop_codon:yes gene_type:complete
MTKKYTIKDIAELAGVSKGTVDRVLHKRGRVSEDALKKVNEILSHIDYRPNPIAKTLKNNKIYRLSLIIPDVKQDSFWSPCLNAVKEVKEKYQNFGISIETSSFATNATNSFLTVSKKVVLSKPDAILMVPLFYKEALEIAALCKTEEIVLSTFNNTIKTANHVNFIGQDLFKSGRIAAKLFDTLLNQGNLVIAHIDQDFDNATHMQAKEKGFRDYFEEKKLKSFHITTLNINHNEREKSINQLETYSNNNKMDGIFITTSKTYIAGIFKQKTMKQVKIVGYDLIGENTALLQEGNIDFLIHQNPQQQTFLGLSQLAEFFLFETKLPKQTLLPIGIINSENFEQYLK